MNLGDVIKNSLQAGLDARSWPKDMADYRAQWRAQGDSFKQTPGAVAFRIYSQTAVIMGQSDKLRDAVYLAVLGEMGRLETGL